jgi:hypothetical protein
MQIFDCFAGSTNQQFVVTTDANTIHTVRWQKDTSKCLDLTNGSQSPGTPVGSVSIQGFEFALIFIHRSNFGAVSEAKETLTNSGLPSSQRLSLRQVKGELNYSGEKRSILTVSLVKPQSASTALNRKVGVDSTYALVML